MDILAEFRQAANRPDAYADEWKRRTGKKVVGYFCSYAPEEILWAAGVLPFRIFGSSERISMADAHLQSYSCSLVRTALEDVLKGKLAFLDGTVFPHTCDSIQRLSDIWRINTQIGFHLDVVLPVKLDTASARRYMAEVMKKFKRDLESALGAHISNRDMIDAAEMYNKIRAGLLKLFHLKSRYPESIRGRDLHSVVKASMIMDRGEYLERLETLSASLSASHRGATSKEKRMLLSGGVCSMPDIHDMIEDAGAVVVWDDLCTGARSFEGSLDTRKELTAAVADRLLERVVCPSKHAGLTKRADDLLDAARAHRADGVVFLFLKFCDPHAFDYPYMKQALDKAGIPNMVLEMEERLPASGQFQTRLDAFMETLDR